MIKVDIREDFIQFCFRHPTPLEGLLYLINKQSPCVLRVECAESFPQPAKIESYSLRFTFLLILSIGQELQCLLLQCKWSPEFLNPLENFGFIKFLSMLLLKEGVVHGTNCGQPGVRVTLEHPVKKVFGLVRDVCPLFWVEFELLPEDVFENLGV